MRAQTIAVDTHFMGEEPSHVLTEADLALLDRARSLSSKVVAFVDKVKTGSTIVMYPITEKIQEFRDLIGGLSMSISDIFSHWREAALGSSSFMQPVRWEWIDKVGMSSFLCHRLYEDIGHLYRVELENYFLCRECSHEELWWINKYAGELLVRAGYLAPVNSGAPPTGGLTGDAPKTLELGGDVRGCIEYPGLPF
jgi:hypothetical protein